MTRNVLILTAASFCWGLACAAAQPRSPLKQIEALLDDWHGRASAREALLTMGGGAEGVVRSVATAADQPHLRRARAISLLATMRDPQSVRTLATIADHAKPTYRCLAIQALAEVGTEETLPWLVRKLDDNSSCMKTITTDPVREHDVLVSDEAVRALEHVTGALPEGKGAEAWKRWWLRRSAGQRKPSDK